MQLTSRGPPCRPAAGRSRVGRIRASASMGRPDEGTMPTNASTLLSLEARMSKPPLPDAAVAMLRKPNPAVITTLRRDGQPVSAATWYLWADGQVLVNMDEGRKRLEHMRADPRVSIDVLDESSWYNHVSIIGHVAELY